jgi:hypothetical protein
MSVRSPKSSLKSLFWMSAFTLIPADAATARTARKASTRPSRNRRLLGPFVLRSLLRLHIQVDPVEAIRRVPPIEFHDSPVGIRRWSFNLRPPMPIILAVLCARQIPEALLHQDLVNSS